MVNTCMKTAGVVGSSVVAMASLAISIAEYVKPEDATLSATSTTPSPAPPSPSPPPSPSSLPPSPSLSPSFITMSPTSPHSPSSFSPPFFPSSKPIFVPFPTASYTPPDEGPTGATPNHSSDRAYDVSDRDFNAMAFGFLLASVFFLVLSICLWRSNKARRSSGVEREEGQDRLHEA